jgi:hypothetical protein
MAVNPRAAAAARGCIASVISFTKTKLPPHVPEMMTIRLTHSAGSDTFLIRLTQINVLLACWEELLRATLLRQKNLEHGG